MTSGLLGDQATQRPAEADTKFVQQEVCGGAPNPPKTAGRFVGEHPDAKGAFRSLG